MILRKYAKTDCAELAELLYDTVHTVNAKDYTREQLDAWATGEINLEAWNESFQAHLTVVAEMDDQIVGFGDMDKSAIWTGSMYIRITNAGVWQRRFVMHWSKIPKPQNLPPTHPSRQDRSLKSGGTPLSKCSRWSEEVSC